MGAALQGEMADVKLGTGLESVGDGVAFVVVVVVDATAVRIKYGLVAGVAFGGGGAFRVGRIMSWSPCVVDDACSVC